MTNQAQSKLKASDDKRNYPTAYVVGLIVGVLLLVACLLIVSTHQLTGLQARIFYDLNNLSDSFTKPALWVTQGLGSGYPIAACVLIPLYFKRYWLAWRFFATVGGALAVTFAMKYIVNAPRPLALLDGQLYQRAIETGPGFPSGHATAATALALTLWFILPAKWRWLPVVWIVVVGVSRVYLGVHTPIDMVGGFAVGLVTVCFIELLPPRIARKLRLDNKPTLLKRGW